MKVRQIAVVFAAAAALVIGTTQAAGAATAGPAQGRGNAEQQREQGERAAKAGRARTGDVIATYKGKKINLSKDGWSTAQVCSEYPDLSVKCFDSEAESAADIAAYSAAHEPGSANALPTAPAGRSTLKPQAEEAQRNGAQPVAAVDGDGTPTCGFGWTCLWQDAGWYGRKLQWSADGSKNLGDWSFRDKASSTCNNDEIGGMSLYDWRTGMPDPEIITALGYCLKNLHVYGYPYGGNWGDKADELVM